MLDLPNPLTHWVLDAKCRGIDSPDSFFPENNKIDTSKAISLCEECPVIIECLKFALSNKIRDGIWGGLTEEGREKVRKNRNQLGKVAI